MTQKTSGAGAATTPLNLLKLNRYLFIANWFSDSFLSFLKITGIMLSRLSLSRTVYARRTVGAGPEGVCFRLYVESKLHTITYLATTANVTTSIEVVITFPTSLLFPAEIFCSGDNRRWEFSLRYFALAIADESSVTSNFIDFFRSTVSKLFFLLL